MLVVLDPAAIAISAATNAQNLASVASDGSNFLVIWADTQILEKLSRISVKVRKRS